MQTFKVKLDDIVIQHLYVTDSLGYVYDILLRWLKVLLLFSAFTT